MSPTTHSPIQAPSRIAAPARGVAAAAVAFFVAAHVARAPGILPESFGAPVETWTLGLPVPRFGAAVWLSVAAALLIRAIRRGRGLLPSCLRVVVSVLFGLALFQMLAIDIPRRRAVLMVTVAAGVFSAVDAGIWRLRRQPTAAVATAIAVAAGAIWSCVALDRSDARPFRTETAIAARRDAIPSAPDMPSILVVSMDTTRARDLGAYGAEHGLTPHLDAFAAASVLFEHASAPAPHTHPSFATLVTGAAPREHRSVSGAPHLAHDVETLAEHLHARGYRTAGFLDNPWLGPEFGLARGYEHLDAHATLERVERWLDKERGAPFLLHVHYFHPHGPYERRAGYEPKGIQIARDRVSARAIQSGEVPGRHGFTDAQLVSIHGLYLSEIGAMDADFGALLRAVEARVDASKLIVCATADHGEEFGERGGMHHSHTLYEELLHVPLMFRAPGLEPARIAETVGILDAAPTLLTLAGLDPLPTASGLSLPLGTGAAPNRLVIAERRAQAGRDLASIRRGRWKLHRREDARGTRRVALYDLWADPMERTDLASEHEAIASELEHAYEAWRAQVDSASRISETPTAVPYSAVERLRSLGYAR